MSGPAQDSLRHHYHELTDLADALAGRRQLHVAARESQDGIVFAQDCRGQVRPQL